MIRIGEIYEYDSTWISLPNFGPRLKKRYTYSMRDIRFECMNGGRCPNCLWALTFPPFNSVSPHLDLAAFVDGFVGERSDVI